MLGIIVFPTLETMENIGWFHVACEIVWVNTLGKKIASKVDETARSSSNQEEKNQTWFKMNAIQDFMESFKSSCETMSGFWWVDRKTPIALTSHKNASESVYKISAETAFQTYEHLFCWGNKEQNKQANPDREHSDQK